MHVNVPLLLETVSISSHSARCVVAVLSVLPPEPHEHDGFVKPKPFVSTARGIHIADILPTNTNSRAESESIHPTAARAGEAASQHACCILKEDTL